MAADRRKAPPASTPTTPISRPRRKAPDAPSRFAPQPQQRQASGPQARVAAPQRLVHDTARGQGRCAPRAGAPAIECGHESHDPTRAARDRLEPGDQRRRQENARDEHQREMREHRQVGGLRRSRLAARLAEGHPVAAAGRARRTRSAARGRVGMVSGGAREGRGHDEELAHEDAERRQTGDGHDTMTRPQPSTGCVAVSPPMSAIRWCL